MIDDLFELTKQGIREILQSDFLTKIRKYTFNDVEYKLTDDTVADMLPNLQAINAGLLDEVVTYDVDGNEVVMTAEEYVNRNNAGFKNKMKNEIDLAKLIKILNEIQTFTALANFGSFDMAKTFYLDAKKEEPKMEEELPENGEEVIEE